MRMLVSLFILLASFQCLHARDSPRLEAATNPDLNHKRGHAVSTDGQPTLVVEMGNTGEVSASKLIRNDSNLLTGDFEQTVVLWDVASGKELRRFHGHTAQIRAMDFRPDTNQLLTAGVDRTARLWDLATGRQLRIFRGHKDAIIAAVFNGDGTRFYTVGSDHTLRVWNTKKRRALHVFHKGFENLDDAGFSADGKRLVVLFEDKTVKLFNPESGNLVSTLSGTPQEKSPNPILNPVVVNQDGSLAIVLDDREGSTVYDLNSATALWKLPFDSLATIGAAAFDSKNGRLAVVVSNVITPPTSDNHEDSTFNPFSSTRSALDDWERHHVKNRLFLFDQRVGTQLGEHPIDISLTSTMVFNTAGTSIFASSADSSTAFVVADTGVVTKRIIGPNNGITALAPSPDGKSLVYSDHSDSLHSWDLATGTLQTWPHKLTIVPSSIRFLEESTFLEVDDDKVFTLWDQNKQEPVEEISRAKFAPLLTAQLDKNVAVAQLSVPWQPAYSVLELNPRSGQHLAEFPLLDWKWVMNPITMSKNGTSFWGFHDGLFTKVDLANRREEWHTPPQDYDVFAMSLDPSERMLLSTGPDNTAQILDATSGAKYKILRGHDGQVEAVAFNSQGTEVLTGSTDETAKLWKINGAKRPSAALTLRGHIGEIESVSFLSNRAALVTGGEDGTVRLWRRSDGSQICTLLGLDSEHWVVVAPDGRFDTNNLDEVKGLHWVFSDDPYHALPANIYVRDYYEPNLLPRLLDSHAFFRDIRPLQSLDRAVPEVTQISVLPTVRPDVIDVEVTVKSGAYQLPNSPKPELSGAYDLHLFRDGQLVDEYPVPSPDTPDATTGPELLKWQGATLVTPEDSSRTILFKNIKVPYFEPGTQVSLSSYAFNRDRVKSETKEVTTPASPIPPTRKAHLIDIGINDYGSAAWKLQYAARDAEQMDTTLFDRLSKAGFVVSSHLLVADDSHHTAAKTDIRNVLAAVASESGPDDIVIISFSGHGFSDAKGAFYLLPSDSNPATVKWPNPTAGDLRNFISSEELSEWMRTMVADEIVLIIDACHAAAGIQTPDFKPGPFGSRGLGQLAYDKRMRILAASQAAGTAAEIGGEIQDGVLTYALIHDGLLAGQAAGQSGNVSIQAWLNYPTRRVPELFRELQAGQLNTFGIPIQRDADLSTATAVSSDAQPPQVPVVFDYRKTPGLSLSPSLSRPAVHAP